MALSKRDTQARYWMPGVVAAGMLYAFGVGPAWARWTDLSDEVEELDDSNEKDKKRVAELESKEQRLNIIRENVQDDPGALVVLDKVNQIPIVPEKATITRVEYRKGDSIKVAGHAKDVPAANQMAAEMRKMATADGKRFFEVVQFDDATRRQHGIRSGADETYEYSLTGTFPRKRAN